MLSIILATGLDDSLGKDNKLLWNIPEDMKFFKETTMNKIVVMGSKTFESLPFKNGLPSRDNIVITSKASGLQNTTSLFFYDDIEEVLELDRELMDEEIFIIGGASIYEQFKEYTDRVYWTLVYEKFPEADTKFNTRWFKCNNLWECVGSKKLCEKATVFVYERR